MVLEAASAVSYLDGVQALLGHIGVVWVLRRPQLIWLPVRDGHGCELVALVGEEQLRPLGVEGPGQLRVQVHQLGGEQHIVLQLLLQLHKLGQ